ncbi:hypothetical protein B0H10DRAFT_986115 [Mycena sp. CBHHK59/15]|nr:hypothetical protein B0H10DRAFT_986115 [Mycena sp. CBHHK59/15]
MLKVPTLYLLAAVLSLVASPALAATSMADRIAACGPGTKVLGNATIEADGHALQYSVLHCPESKPPARIVRDNSAELEARQSAELDARQTCTQCPCANGSIQCFCSNIPGQFLDSRAYTNVDRMAREVGFLIVAPGSVHVQLQPLAAPEPHPARRGQLQDALTADARRSTCCAIPQLAR